MKKQLKNIMLSLVFLAGFLGKMQIGYGQVSSQHDSLRLKLTYFYDTARDDKLKHAVKEAQKIYKSNAINPLLAKKLLLVDSLSIANDSADLDKQIVLAFAESLVQVFQYLSPTRKNPDYATSLSNLASLYYKMAQYEKAIPLRHQVVDIRKEALGEAHPDYASSLFYLASTYRNKGDYAKAILLYNQELAIKRKLLGKVHPEIAFRLGGLATLYDMNKEYAKALSLYQQELAIQKKLLGEVHPEIARIMGLLASLYLSKRDYAKALPLYEQALAIRKKLLGEVHLEIAGSLYNLATLYSSNREYAKALPLYEQALAIKKKLLGEVHSDIASSLESMANLYYYPKGEHAKSLSLYQEALAIRKKLLGNVHLVIASSSNYLAFLYYSEGEYGKALPLYQEALAIRKKLLGEVHLDYANSLSGLASLYYSNGEYLKALPLYQKALAIRKKLLGEEHPDIASSLNSLGALYIDLDKEKEAEPLLTQAANITLKSLNSKPSYLSEIESLVFLGQGLYQLRYLPALLSTQHNKISSVSRQIYQNELVVKGIILKKQQQVLSIIRKSGDTAALKLYEQWRYNKALLGKQLLLPIVERLSNRDYLDSLQEATNKQEQHLSLISTGSRNLQRSQAVKVKDVAFKLTKEEAAIEFISYRLYKKKWADSTLYAALVLMPGDTNVRYVPLFEEKQLQRLLQSSSNRVNVKSTINKLYPGYSGSGALPALQDSLYQLIWHPLEKHLKGIQTVYYAPTRLLHRIAFAALQVNSHQVLIDNYHLTQVLTTGSIAQAPAPVTAPRSASLWGNIDYNLTKESLPAVIATRGQSSSDTLTSSFNIYNSDSRAQRGESEGWNPLPYSKAEIDSLEMLMVKAGVAVNTCRGAIATEDALKALDGKSPQVMHLATHGFFLPVIKNNKNEFDRGGSTFTQKQDPMFRSGLVLAGGNNAWQGKPALADREDGILTAYEIAQLDLSNTDLMVLSACGTALGDVQGNEGVIGLQRALKLAGVKQMIISLWDVPDKATMELMTMFYRNWLSGQSTRDALRNAQLRMKQNYPPFYWAAFVVVE